MTAVENIRYKFFTRKNGVSTGDFESLNCSIKVGDDDFSVRENMRRVAGNLGCSVEHIFVLHQTHSSIVVPVLIDAPFEKTPYADALVTKLPHIYLGIKTADCAPVLFFDKKNGVIGAAHAGWKGAISGILENTIDEMIKLGAKLEDISAIIGPCIAQESYEVGDDMKEELLNADIKASVFFKEIKKGKYNFNLSGYVLERLKRKGIEQPEWVEKDTYALFDDYFSHRRSFQKGEKSGRQISVIGLFNEDLY